MGTKTARRAPEEKERSVFVRHGGGPSNSNKICIFWLKGRCLKNPCQFAHGETPHVARHPCSSLENHSSWSPYCRISKHTLLLKSGRRGLSNKISPENFPKKSLKRVPEKSSKNVDENSLVKKQQNMVEKSSENGPEKSRAADSQKFLDNISGKSFHNSPEIVTQKTLETIPKEFLEDDFQNSPERVCQLWLKGECARGDHCHDLHSWFRGEGFAMLAKLPGHQKAVTGIVLPRGSDKLFSSSLDGTVRVWDCQTGKCAWVTNLGGEVRSIVSEGSWVVVGLSNLVKMWNIESGAEYSLNEPIGQVNALEVVDNLVFAGVKDGAIYAWRGGYETSLTLQLAAVLRGHTCGITSLVAGAAKRLYSGSMDHTIRVWNHETFQCIMTLKEHNDVVTSLLCWDNYLLSSSLDCTVKVWAATEEGNFEVIYLHSEKRGVLALNGMTDGDDKPIVYCACGDNSVHLYELPSFADRGRLFANQEVETVGVGPWGHFFTGDQSGLVTVWKWPAAPNVAT